MNLIDNNSAPKISKTKVYLHILLIRFIIPLKLSWFKDSFIIILSDKLILLPIAVKIKDINVMNP